VTTWALEVRQLDGTAIDTDVTFRDLQATWVLNGPGLIDADLTWDSVAVADHLAGGRELRLTRDATRVWGGWSWRGAGNGPERTFRIEGQGYYSRLRRRVVRSDLIYTDTAQHTIAWNLIAHAQAQSDGNHGFTNGTHSGTPRDRDRSYCALERPNIADEIEALAGMDDGFDFEISPTKAFNTWAPRRGTGAAVYTFTGVDEFEFEWEDDATEAASFVDALGDDDCNPREITATDAGAVADYGRLEYVVQADTNRRSEVSAEANEHLRQRKVGMRRATLTYDLTVGPAWATLNPLDHLGSKVRLNLASAGPATFDRNYRIVEFLLSLEDPTAEWMTLVLDGALP
jgi:hypothetical protein